MSNCCCFSCLFVIIIILIIVVIRIVLIIIGIGFTQCWEKRITPKLVFYVLSKNNNNNNNQSDIKSNNINSTNKINNDNNNNNNNDWKSVVKQSVHKNMSKSIFEKFTKKYLNVPPTKFCLTFSNSIL